MCLRLDHSQLLHDKGAFQGGMPRGKRSISPCPAQGAAPDSKRSILKAGKGMKRSMSAVEADHHVDTKAALSDMHAHHHELDKARLYDR